MKTCCLLFLYVFIHGQDKKEFPFNLNSYYDDINIAEKNLIQGNHIESSNYYYKAFKKNKTPFFHDVFNSFIINSKLKNKRSLEDYKMLKNLKYNFKEVNDSLFFKNFSEKFSKNIKKYIPTNKVNPVLIKTLDSLTNADQKYRMLSGSKRETYKNEIRRNDSLNAFKLKSIFDKYGFISEYDIGIANTTNIRFLPYQIIILHQQQYMDKKFVNFEPYLRDALISGKINNRVYTFLIEGFGNSPKGLNFFDILVLDENSYIDKRVLRENQSDNDKAKILEVEQNRKKIKLCTLKEQIEYKFFSDSQKIYILEIGQKKIFNNVDDSFKKMIESKTLKLDIDLINKINLQN